VFGLDDRIAALAAEGAPLVALALALLLGFRPATDPDRRLATSTQVAIEPSRPAGHATVLASFA